MSNKGSDIMMAERVEQPDQESRLLAAVAHAAVVAQGLGLLVGILVYISQRDRSRYAAFQALQAAVYQLISLIIIIGSWVVWGIFYALTWIPLFMQIESAPDAPPPPLFWVGLGSMVIPFALMIILGLYGLWGALRTWQGADFRYALVGRALERSSMWQNRAPRADAGSAPGSPG